MHEQRKVAQRLIQRYAARRRQYLKDWAGIERERLGLVEVRKLVYKTALDAGYSYNSVRRMIAEAGKWILE